MEYTVNLTAERDTIVQRLEECDRELVRELNRKRANQNSNGNQGESPRGKKIDRMNEKKSAGKVSSGHENSLSFVCFFFFLMIFIFD